jgi:hypothetical protein
MPSAPTELKLAAIFSADVVGYRTKITNLAGALAWLVLR